MIADQPESLTPESFQVIMTNMQLEFQKKIETLQASGDYVEIAPASEQFKAEERSVEGFRILTNQPLAYGEYSEKEFQNTLVLAENVQTKLSTAGTWAGDAAPYVHALRIGYMANYMTSKDCWVCLRRSLRPISD